MPVALLAEGVDRNSFLWPITVTGIVALLAEGVDRNLQAEQSFRAEAQVALLAEGVDRNFSRSCTAAAKVAVALLAEGVDRNHIPVSSTPSSVRRPPRGGRG